jgi:Tfp pilus assembly protein PilN
MNSRNLIPIRTQAVKRRKRAVQRWLLINGVYFVCLAVIGVAYAGTALHRDGPSEAPPSAVPAAQSPADILALTRQVASLRTTLRSVQQVTDRPDWSILLAAISQSLGDDVVLNAVDCTQGDTAATSSAEVPEELHITGIAQTENAVTRFVLAVENLRFFTHVRLVQTAPQVLRGRDCVGFELLCSIPRDTRAEK